MTSLHLFVVRKCDGCYYDLGLLSTNIFEIIFVSFFNSGVTYRSFSSRRFAGMTYGGTGSHVFDPHALLGEFLGSKGRVGLEMVELGVNFIQASLYRNSTFLRITTYKKTREKNTKNRDF